MMLINYFSIYEYIYLFLEKSQFLDMLKKFKAKVENQLDKIIKSIKPYHDGE